MQTYANIASATASQPLTPRPITPKNIPPVLIKPKRKQDAEITKAELYSKINPRKLNVSINSVKTTKDGVVVIKCNRGRISKTDARHTGPEYRGQVYSSAPTNEEAQI